MIYLSILAALLLFLLLAATIARSVRALSDVQFSAASGLDFQPSNGSAGRANQTLHFEVVQRIFNQDDHKYVAEVGEPRVARLLLLERKRVAMAWIRRKEAEARFIMREHTHRARAAEDLEVSSEVRLAFEYFELQALCELLAFAVFFFGPAGLQGLALRTNGILSGMRRLGGSAALDAEAA